jgi:hypothetical protein
MAMGTFNLCKDTDFMDFPFSASSAMKPGFRRSHDFHTEPMQTIGIPPGKKIIEVIRVLLVSLLKD